MSGFTNGGEDPEQIDITVDLENSDHSAPPGADGSTSTPEGTVRVEEVAPSNKPISSSLRDQLSSAMRGDSAETTDTNAKDEKLAPALTQDAEGRWRRVDGTFASIDEVQAFSAKTEEKPANVESIASQLPAAIAEQFKSLPAEMQGFFARTMEDLNTRATRYAEYDQLESIIGPRRDAWAANGMNSVVAVNQLFALSDFAGTNPGDFVLWFAENNNIDLDALLDARDAAQASIDPNVAQLQNQVQQLNHQLQQYTNNGQAAPQQNEYLQVVQNFASEKDEGGNLKRPYLAEITDILPAHITAIRSTNPNLPPAQILAQAYQNACWASPTVRIKMQAEIDKQNRHAAKQKADAARLAGSSIRGGPSGTGASHTPQTGNLSLRDELKRNFASFGNA